MPAGPRRRFLALTAGALLVLGACSSSEETAAGVAVDGGVGETPTMTFPDAEPSGELEVDYVTEGDGREVGADDFVAVDYVGQVWGGDVFDSSFERGAPTMFSLNQVVQGWKDGLTGVPVGSRVVLSLPPELGYGPSGGNQQAGIGPDDTIVFTVDVLGAYAPDQSGDPEAEPTGAEVPVTVEGELGAPATVTIPEGAPAPEGEPQLTVTATGTGEEIPEGGAVVLQYSATTWDNATTESTWDVGQPIQVTLGGSIFDGLAGHPAGSRAVVLVPGQTDPTSGQEFPPMAAVVDVLDVLPAAAG